MKWKTLWRPLAAILIFCLMQVVTGIIMSTLVTFTDEKQLHNEDYVMVPENIIMKHPALLSLSITISGIITVGFLNAMKLIRKKTFRLRTIDWKHAPLGVVGALLGIVASNLLVEQLNLPDMMELEFGQLSKSVWGVFAIVLVGPIVEELVFREAVLGYMIKHGTHRRTAILLSAAAFGLVHFNPAQIPFAFIMGIILGVIYAKTRNIWLPIAIHVLNNAMAMADMYAQRLTNEKLNYTELMGGPVVAWLVILVCAAMCVMFLREYWRKYHRRHTR